MTSLEQKTVNAIGLKQVEMETNQHYMSKDLQEMKDDIKEIKEALSNLDEKLEKKFFTRLEGRVIQTAITIAATLLGIWAILGGKP